MVLANAVLAATKHDRICGRCMMLEVNYACSGLFFLRMPVRRKGQWENQGGIEIGLDTRAGQFIY